LQYRLRNKPKSIKIIDKSSSKNIFSWILHIYTLHLTTFFKNKKRGKNKKNVKKRKKRDLNKKNVKNVFYVYRPSYVPEGNIQ